MEQQPAGGHGKTGEAYVCAPDSFEFYRMPACVRFAAHWARA